MVLESVLVAVGEASFALEFYREVVDDCVCGGIDGEHVETMGVGLGEGVGREGDGGFWEREFLAENCTNW